MRIHVQQLMQHKPEALWDVLTGEFELEFDDGEVIQTNHKETIYSRYFWEMFLDQSTPDPEVEPKLDLDRYGWELPILKKYHVSTVLNGKPLNAKTHLDLFNVIYWDIFKAYDGNLGDNKVKMARRVYEQTNDLYNDVVVKLGQHVTGVNVFDLLEIYKHPKVTAVRNKMKPNPESIEKGHNKLLDLIKKLPEFDDNPVAMMVRSGITRVGQVLQILGRRGYLTDINSHIIAEPIMRGFLEGLNQLKDTLKESRSASKALFFTSAPLQDTEYFNRRMKLVSAYVQRLHYGDCGTDEYVSITVRDNGDSSIYGHRDLQTLKGKYYLTDSGLQAIQGDETHLIGKTIQVRSIIKCKHDDNQGVCSTCYGQLADSVMPGSNIGFVSVIEMCRFIAQRVLSTKHYDGSSKVDDVHIEEDVKWLMQANEDNSGYRLTEAAVKHGLKVIFKDEDVSALGDIFVVPNTSLLLPSRVSEIEFMSMEYQNGNDVVNVPGVRVEAFGRKPHLSAEALEYIKEHQWTTDRRNNFVIDMSEWDYTQPFMVLPFKEFNMADMAKALEKEIEGTVKMAKERGLEANLDHALINLSDMINSRLNVNFANVEGIFYSMMINDYASNDYSLPKGGKGGYSVYAKQMEYRSAAPAMAFQRQDMFLYRLSSYLVRNRMDHPYDAIVMPEIIRPEDMGLGGANRLLNRNKR